MDFSNVKAVTIPEGDVKAIAINGTTVWEKKTAYTIHFQQLINSTQTSGSRNGVNFTKNANGSWTIAGTTTAVNTFWNINYVNGVNANKFIANHKYLSSIQPMGVSHLLMGILTENGVEIDGTAVSIWTSSSNINHPNPFEVTSVPDNAITWVRWQAGEAAGGIFNETRYPMLFDLTAMFADATEIMPTSLAEFKALFPDDYYAYTAQPYEVTIYA